MRTWHASHRQAQPLNPWRHTSNVCKLLSLVGKYARRVHASLCVCLCLRNVYVALIAFGATGSPLPTKRRRHQPVVVADDVIFPAICTPMQIDFIVTLSHIFQRSFVIIIANSTQYPYHAIAWPFVDNLLLRECERHAFLYFPFVSGVFSTLSFFLSLCKLWTFKNKRILGAVPIACHKFGVRWLMTSHYCAKVEITERSIYRAHSLCRLLIRNSASTKRFIILFICSAQVPANPPFRILFLSVNCPLSQWLYGCKRRDVNQDRFHTIDIAYYLQVNVNQDTGPTLNSVVDDSLSSLYLLTHGLEFSWKFQSGMSFVTDAITISKHWLANNRRGIRINISGIFHGN